MNALITLINMVAWLLQVMLIVWIVLGLLAQFNIVNARQPFVAAVMRSLDRFFEPILRPIRRILPTPGGIDFSPAVLLILIIVIRTLLVDDILIPLALR